MRYLALVVLSFFLFSCSSTRPGKLELVAELDVNPGNLAVSSGGRVFATVHQFRPSMFRVIEVLDSVNYEPWPNAKWNRGFGLGKDSFNSPLGIQIDSRDRVWIIDNGLGNPAQPPRLFAFDLESGRLLYRHEFDETVGPLGSLLQDLAVDEQDEFVYIADVGLDHPPAIVVVDVKNDYSWRLEGHDSFAAEDVDLVVENLVLQNMSPDGSFSPARVGINPITLSADKQTLFFGAMNGQTWYSLPAALLRSKAKTEYIFKAIKRVGSKPVSDGASTDIKGNHYFTNLAANGIDVMSPSGELKRLVRSDEMLWSDALSFGPEGWLYVAVNQLHRSPFFSGGVERAEPPYTIWRVATGVESTPGR